MSESLSEAMKAVEALAESLGKVIIINGKDIPKDTSLAPACYARNKSGDYTYTVKDNS